MCVRTFDVRSQLSEIEMMSAAWFVDWSEVELEKRLAFGTYGEVWQGRLRHKMIVKAVSSVRCVRCGMWCAMLSATVGGASKQFDNERGKSGAKPRWDEKDKKKKNCDPTFFGQGGAWSEF